MRKLTSRVCQEFYVKRRDLDVLDLWIGARKDHVRVEQQRTRFSAAGGVGGVEALMNRPLDQIYGVLLIDTIVIKVRDVRRSIRQDHVAIGVNLDFSRATKQRLLEGPLLMITQEAFIDALAISRAGRVGRRQSELSTTTALLTRGGRTG